MQPIQYLSQWLSQKADHQHYLFLFNTVKSLFPSKSTGALKTLLSRAVQLGLLKRICRGVYLYPQAQPSDGLLLFHTAAALRASHYNYISLETALSDSGVISQIPMNWITIMSSGRSNKISCGDYGTIEFIHTNQKIETVMNELAYDAACGLWRASAALAIRDMKTTNRNCDLIDWDVANELIRSARQ